MTTPATPVPARPAPPPLVHFILVTGASGGIGRATAARTSKRARLYPALHQQASDRGIQVVFGKRLVSAEPHPRRRQRQK